MGLFSFIKSSVTELAHGLGDSVAKFTEKSFLEAAVASAFVIAAADGNLSSDEINKLKGFIERNDALKVFDTNTVGAVFNKVRSEFEFDTDMGNDLAKKLIEKVAGNEERVHTLMRLACVIGRADGNFDDSEKAAARKIARWVGADPSNYDL